MVDIDEIVSRAIPIPCKCTWETMKAQERREKLKQAILDLLQEKDLSLRKPSCDEDIGRVGTDEEKTNENN